MKTLKDLFLSELSDMYDAEQRIVGALPSLAKAATCNDLKAAFRAHLNETEGHVTKLEEVFEAFNERPKGSPSEATKGLLAEAAEVAAKFGDSPVINAALISAAQKIEHYEIASYGCLHAWSKLLGNVKASGVLESILDQEKGANQALTALAATKSNKEALDNATPKRNEVVGRGL